MIEFGVTANESATSRSGKITITRTNTSAEFLVVQGLPSVTISGRVLNPSGLGVRNAIVSITDAGGARRTAITSTLGFYSFERVEPGKTHVLSVASRRYRFEPKTLIVTDDLADTDFVGLE